MSSEKVPLKPTENQGSGARKTGSPRPPEPALKCPRCDSPNTKFCYYNNYNLSQPRHFCKTCRRYWTKGGALRNVPVGGGCRKNKKMKSSSSRLSDDSKDSGGGSFDSSGFKFFHGITPAMEFQYGNKLPFSRLNSPSSTSVYNHLFSFGDLSSSATPTTTSSGLSLGNLTNPSCFDIDGVPTSSSLMGFRDQSSGGGGGGFNWGVQVQDNNISMNVHSSIATSIESLSSLNQDLHWKLQQQRLAMLYVGENHKESNTNISSVQGGLFENQQQQQQQQQPISFQNLEISKPDQMCGGGNNTNSTTNTPGWLFDNSYTPATTTTSSNSNGNDGMSIWNGVQAWSGMHQYSDLPQ